MAGSSKTYSSVVGFDRKSCRMGNPVQFLSVALVKLASGTTVIYECHDQSMFSSELFSEPESNLLNKLSILNRYSAKRTVRDAEKETDVDGTVPIRRLRNLSAGITSV